MATVIEVPPIRPTDPNAIYVWAGVTGPARGTLPSFQAAKIPAIKFSADDWMTAIEAAMADAHRYNFLTVYVVRNA